MKACIISIGNELLRGKTVNTNASDFGMKLTLCGYDVVRGFTVMDDPKEIAWALEVGMESADLVLTTGGLGPTFDDMTVESISKALGIPLIMDSETSDRLRKRYKMLGLEPTPERLKMAMIPRGSKALYNPVGAAPGIMLSDHDKTIIILPGVPEEANAILDSIMDIIRIKGVEYYSESRYLKGVMESSLVPIVNKVMKKMNSKVYIKSHPRHSETGNPAVELEILARSDKADHAKDLVEKAFDMVFGELNEVKK
ncbi:MAG: molybdopterin-binding protein [Candidatus Thermoplasmatota archaeon]|nr:molybdopterin-binding protein [Candidatus Thermoplasmatota archaeon]